MVRYVMRDGTVLGSRERGRHRGRYVLRDETRITKGLYYPVRENVAVRVERMIECGTVGEYRKLWSDSYDDLTVSLDRDLKGQWAEGYIKIDGRKFAAVYNK